MVRLIADIFPAAVHWEGNAQFDKAEKCAHGTGRFAQGNVTVHAPTGKQRLRHVAHAVRRVSAHCQLIVRLLVGTRIPRGTHLHSFGDNRDIPDASLPEANCRSETGRAAADDYRIKTVKRDLLCHVHPHNLRMWNPPSTSIMLPVE